MEVSWTADPFGTVAARNAEVINDVAAGLLTVDEGRAVKGRPPLEASQAPQPQQEPDDDEEAEADDLDTRAELRTQARAYARQLHHKWDDTYWKHSRELCELTAGWWSNHYP